MSRHLRYGKSLCTSCVTDPARWRIWASANEHSDAVNEQGDQIDIPIPYQALLELVLVGAIEPQSVTSQIRPNKSQKAASLGRSSDLLRVVGLLERGSHEQ